MSGDSPTAPQSISMAAVDGQNDDLVSDISSVQPEFAAPYTDWDVFDVPRIWDSVRGEDDPAAWAQVIGWTNLSQALDEQHKRLLQLRTALAAGWDPGASPAAAAFLRVVDGLLQALREDACAHASTANGLHGVLTALKNAKAEIRQLKLDWDYITTDKKPESWARDAARLNYRARAVMIESEKAVKDHRAQILIPPQYEYRGSTFVGTPAPDPKAAPKAASSTELTMRVKRSGPPPPVPGTDPTGANGPVLSGSSPPAPVVPGSPVSVLPIPPGNPYAPGGGAYVLPGPGVGRGGWIVPMPEQMLGAAATRPGNVGGGVHGAAGGVGMLPMTMGAGGGRSGGGGSRSGRPGDLVWEVGEGVPPVIGEVVQPEQFNAQKRDTLDASFAEWFKGVATPWADEGMSVTINRREAHRS